MSIFEVVSLSLQIILFIAFLVLCVKYVSLKSKKESEYYTDYIKGNLILRIYKPEFEYQAIGKIPRDKLLDGGNFSQLYKWALIER